MSLMPRPGRNSGSALSPCIARMAQCAAAVAAIAVLTSPAAAIAAPQPIGLSVVGGEQSWHPDNAFTVSWSNPAGVAAVHYRVLGPTGQVAVAQRRLAWPATTIQPLALPSTPGAYTLEVRLEDALGAIGAPVTAALRFDDRPPGAVEPEPRGGWIGRTSFPLTLRFGAPAGPEPLAGIRGYAVSIDERPGLAPCAGPRLCSDAETDLHGGVAANTLVVPELPEGISQITAVAVSGSGVRSEQPRTTALRIDKTDPLTHLSGVADGWSRRPLTLVASSTDAAAGMVADGIGPAPYTAIRVDDGAPVLAAGNTVATTVISSGLHRISYYARDAAGNLPDGGSVNGRAGHPPGEAVVRIDREPPALAFASAQDPAAPEMIVAPASDRLSGLDRSRGSIAVRRIGSAERFEELASEIAGGVLRARWDSDAHSRGQYEFRATAYDLAGNLVTTTRRANGTAMRLSSPLKVATRLVAEVDRPVVPFGGEGWLAGRLLAGRRAPLAGALVQVIERFDAGPRQQRVASTVRTDSAGRFGVRLGPGPSREVIAVFAPTPRLSGASSAPKRLAVQGRVQLRASARLARVGGHPLTLSGRVAGGMPAGGKAVELQFRLPKLTWSEFRTVRTDPQGRFHYRYRFADDDSRGVRFEFRAYVPAQAGWPYEPAGSRPVAVRGV